MKYYFSSQTKKRFQYGREFSNNYTNTYSQVPENIHIKRSRIKKILKQARVSFFIFKLGNLMNKILLQTEILFAKYENLNIICVFSLK